VIALLALFPRSIVSAFGVAVRAKLPSGFTVSAIVVLAFTLPEVPVMVTTAVPFFAVELAVKVTTLEEAVGSMLKEAVTPLGSPDAAKATLPENPFAGVTLIVLVPLPTPSTLVTVLGEVERVKLGAPLVTVRFRLVVLIRDPDVPLIVRTAVVGLAVAFTVKVNVLLVTVGFGSNAAVTPLGRPEIDKRTLPAKPPCGMTVIALVALLPWITINEVGLATRVKFGAGSGQLLTKLAALIVPIPVAKSQPVVVA
jgi:hypothetical protein